MRSSTESRAVSINTGTRCPERRSSRQTSNPFFPGIITSRIIKSYELIAAWYSASSPFATTSTAYACSRSPLATKRAIRSSSSTSSSRNAFSPNTKSPIDPILRRICRTRTTRRAQRPFAATIHLHRKTMLAFRVHNANLVAVSKPLPKLRPGWALVRVRLAGICNTDSEILRGYHNFRGTPGHEFVGEVAGVRGLSAQQSKRWLGQRVTGEINVSCSAYGYRPVCEFCRRGLKTHCARRTVLGIVAHDGAFAEYLALPLQNLHRVPDSITDQQAVFVEPLAAACEILDQLKIQNFREAAVLGDGKLAQLIARVLRAKLPHVVMYGKHQSKLALARRAGVKTKRVRGNSSDAKQIKQSYRLVVEATGSPSGLALAQQITEPRGTLILKSTFHGTAPVETWPIVVKEITVVGSRCGPFAKAISLLRSRKVDPTPLITRTFPLSAAPEAIRFAQTSNAVKVLLRPSAKQ